MAVEFEDVLKAEVVLVGVGLLNTVDAFEAFRAAIKTDTLVSGHTMAIDAQTNMAEAVRIISLNRDRIALEISSPRSTIRREYPEEKDLDRLAEVSGQAITKTTLTGQNLRAFGYNLDLVYDQDSGQLAAKYLADRLFSNDIPHRKEWQLVGGASRMVYKEGANQWQITVEPRFNDPTTTKIFLTVNLHKDKNVPPEQCEIRDSLQEAWQQARMFVCLLDKGGM